MRWEDVTQPTAEPVSVPELKAWLRIEHGEDDVLLNELVRAARSWVERYTGRALAQRQVRQWAQAFRTDLALVPALSIDEVRVHYEDGTSALLSTSDWRLEGEVFYVLNVPSGARLRTEDWLEIVYTVDVSPEPELKLAVRQLVAYWYEQRQAAVERYRWERAPEAAGHLIHSLRRWVVYESG